MAVVGRIARAHGIKGQVIVNPETDFLEERFQVGARLSVGRAADDSRDLTITSARFHSGRPVIGLSGVVDMNTAIALAGCELRVPADTLVELPPGTYYRHDLVGCSVETSEGASVGEVVKVEGTPSGSRLVVRDGDDDILIPLVDAICTTIDPASRRIVIAPPPGLLELNRKA